MGLDSVDLVFRIRKNFDVELSPQDFQDPPAPGSKRPTLRTTVGDLYEVVVSKRALLDLPPPENHLKEAAITDVCRTLAEVTEIPEEAIGLDDRLEEFLPRKGRRRMWRRMGRTLKVKLPPLVADRPWYRITWWLIFGGTFTATCVWLVWLLRQSDDPWLSIMLSVPLGLVSGLMVAAATAGVVMYLPWWPLRGIPRGMITIEHLAQFVLACNRKYYVELCGSDSNEDIWPSLQAIVADVLDVDLGEVTKEADLIKDLGMA